MTKDLLNLPGKRYLLLGAVLFSMPVCAQSPRILQVESILVNLQEQIPYLIQFTTAFCYLSGIFFSMQAMYHLKAYGEMRTMMAVQTDLRGPMLSLCVASSLFFLPSIFRIGLVSFYGNGEILLYEEQGSSWDHMLLTIISLVQFVGGVAFIRGLYIFHKLGHGQAQPGTFSKGFVHIIAGVIALNIVGAYQILCESLGIVHI